MISENALVTIQEFKNYYGIDGINPETDDLISFIIDSISSMFTAYCNKNIVSQTYTERYDGNALPSLIVKQYPIISVTSIHSDTSWIFGTNTMIPSASYTYDTNTIHFKDILLCNGIKNIKIVYEAGYETVPYDIGICCLNECVKRYKRRTDPDILSKSLPDGSISYSNSPLMKDTIMVLNKYKRFTVI